MRVEKENHAFAKRLFEQQAIIQKKTFDKEYASMKKYRQNLIKVPADKKALRSASVSQLQPDENASSIAMPSPFLKGMQANNSSSKKELPPISGMTQSAQNQYNTVADPREQQTKSPSSSLVQHGEP